MPQRLDVAQSMPTKLFFVGMLTRDISLEDAILDLVDNCLDGALRIAGGEAVKYSDYVVEITMTADGFVIADNCGGISRDIAVNYAFKMGRESDDGRDSEVETIGMYGVGMKRAIFKMGRDARVKTRYGDDCFEVAITPEWLESKTWDPLPVSGILADGERLEGSGTLIQVTQLYDGVSRQMSNAGFENDLRGKISEHFAVFLKQGFVIKVNGRPVDAVRVEMLVLDQPEQPAPFVFSKTIDGVGVTIAVGLNATHFPGDDDDEDLTLVADRSSATAGWTVLCNNRAVIVGDKTRLTGWGDGIPLFHPQFAILTGVIEFRSPDAEKLPVTTTKRALDTSSNVWLESIGKMKEGMRVWITYTNQWKNRPLPEKAKVWEGAASLPLGDVCRIVCARQDVRRYDGVVEFNPQKAGVLPSPPGVKPSTRRVVFTRPLEEIKSVATLLFDNADEKPGAVGEKCFEMQFMKLKRSVREVSGE